MFRPLVAAASLLEALAAAAFATAAFSDPMQRLPITFSAPSSELDVFNRVTSLDWSSDRGMLIAAIVFFIAFFVLLRAALPRPRFDQLMSWGWKLMLPLSLGNLLVTGALVLALQR